MKITIGRYELRSAFMVRLSVGVQAATLTTALNRNVEPRRFGLSALRGTGRAALRLAQAEWRSKPDRGKTVVSATATRGSRRLPGANQPAKKPNVRRLITVTRIERPRIAGLPVPGRRIGRRGLATGRRDRRQHNC